MLFAVVLLGILFSIVFGLFLHDMFSKRNINEESSRTPAAASEKSEPALPENQLPKNLYMGKKAPEAVFYTSEGAAVSPDDMIRNAENGVRISFGETACGVSCEQMTQKYGFAHVIVGDAASADDSVLIVSDRDGAVYGSWGIQVTPTEVILGPSGVVLEYRTGKMTAGEMEGLLKCALEGRDSVGYAFITETMSGGNGGVATNTSAHGKSPSGRDVLSESQGLMMLYGLAVNDRDIFDKSWQFTRSNLLKNGVAAWYVSADGVQADVNALLDDLRIWYALYLAENQWPGTYEADAEALLAAIKEYCLDEKNRLVDFTDLNTGKRSDTISLQYLDIRILRSMAEMDPDFQAVCDNAEKILLDGFISDDFPLFYNNYNYTNRAYDQGNLNTAEALYTLWNLSKADLLPEVSLNWLRTQTEQDTLAARYRKNGTPVPGYEFHSTAVYGLAALVAEEAGDEALFEMALRRMGRQFVLDADDSCFGAYAQKGATIYSFDQLIPLLANAALDRNAGNGRK